MDDNPYRSPQHSVADGKREAPTARPLRWMYWLVYAQAIAAANGVLCLCLYMSWDGLRPPWMSEPSVAAWVLVLYMVASFAAVFATVFTPCGMAGVLMAKGVLPFRKRLGLFLTSVIVSGIMVVMLRLARPG